MSSFKRHSFSDKLSISKKKSLHDSVMDDLFEEIELLDEDDEDMSNDNNVCNFIYRRRKNGYKKGDQCLEYSLNGKEYCKEHLKQSKKRKRQDANKVDKNVNTKKNKVDLLGDVINEMNKEENTKEATKETTDDNNNNKEHDEVDNEVHNLSDILGETDEIVAGFYCDIIESFENLGYTISKQNINFKGSADKLRKNPQLAFIFKELFNESKTLKHVELTPAKSLLLITLLTIITTFFGNTVQIGSTAYYNQVVDTTEDNEDKDVMQRPEDEPVVINL